MFKVLILQKYYGLSDEATEFEIADRDSFKHFLGLELGDDIPDARTIWDFKQRIEHIFERMSQMGAEYCRSIGLRRARQHNSLRNLVYNMDRYPFLIR